MTFTFEQTKEQFILALNSNAYLNMCTCSDMKNAISALEKQIPKKPVIKYHKEDVTPVKYGRLMEFHCPNCDRLVAAMYETDHKRGGGIHRGLKGCCTCLQAIDFGEYYYMSNLDEKIELE